MECYFTYSTEAAKEGQCLEEKGWPAYYVKTMAIPNDQLVRAIRTPYLCSLLLNE